MGQIAETRYMATQPALTDGQAQDFLADINGNPKTIAASSRITALTSATYNSPATLNSSDITLGVGRGIILWIDVTTWTASGTSTTVNIQGQFNGHYLTIYTFAPTISATGLQAFLFYPGAASAASWTAAPVQGVIPSVFRVQVVTVGTVNYIATYGVDFVS